MGSKISINAFLGLDKRGDQKLSPIARKIQNDNKYGLKNHGLTRVDFTQIDNKFELPKNITPQSRTTIFGIDQR